MKWTYEENAFLVKKKITIYIYDSFTDTKNFRSVLLL